MERVEEIGLRIARVDLAVVRVGQHRASVGGECGCLAKEHQREHDEHPGGALEQGSHPVRGAGDGTPQDVADGSGGPKGGQARPAAARTAAAIGAVALVGWALLATGGGGIDPGDGLGGPGPRAAFLALALGAPLAAVAVLCAWNRRAFGAAPSRIVLLGAGGLAVWSGLSVLWAAAPDLAWIDADRQAIAVCALLLGLALGTLLPGAPRLLGVGLSAAAALPLAIALGSKVFPATLGADSDLARLSAPVGYWNGLALVAVTAVPGLLWLAGGSPTRRGGLAVAGAGLTAVTVTVLLTYSRGGILAMAMAGAVTIAFLPRRTPALAALGVALACAAFPTAYALTDPLLRGDQIPTALREGAGRSLGWRIAASLVIAALLAPVLARAAGRLRIDRRRGRRILAIGSLGCILVVAGGFAASHTARGWAGDRVAEFRGEGGDAVSNDPGRLVNTAGNQRKGWWGEAWRGFRDAPVLGQGAGGFALVHLRERHSGDDAPNKAAAASRSWSTAHPRAAQSAVSSGS